MADITVKVAEILGKNLKHLKRPGKIDWNQSKLNKAEIVLLMLSLKENGAFSKDITNSQLADCFGNVTGYSGEQLRQAMSKSLEETIKKENFENVSKILRNALAKVEEDKRKLLHLKSGD